MTDRPTLPEDLRAAIAEHRGRFTFLGWALIVLGVLAILFPLVASIAAKVLIGWLLLLSGAIVLYSAFQARRWRSALATGAIGVLQIAAGVYLAFFPLTGLIGLTFLMAILFLAQGVMELMLWNQHRPAGRGAGWLLFSAICSVALGVLLILGLPGTALWALGLMLGINLLSSGVSFLTLTRMAG
ncbi:HdeD family acid-resistance protein [Wenxinia marina]|uniref:Acid-resistance membrane protein n=1 Tax=Wenxinia marina DSM 24838 TaxID=1123501 RepID=A0A0D0Q629_9RHOB|nr:HdeD family acid-resistance protein [Wenxinia marina]KIQ67932.1 hypothetical protein Wenmar_03387 [Wenxinia marina DSM 24838]GGL76100.1 hypothetical protein GCM10011392_33360 [Wenxinia marina]